MRTYVLTQIRFKLNNYAQLVRLDKPIGTALLLWPTLTALWFASGGLPDWQPFVTLLFGTFLMRSAGCAINDYADKDFDQYVSRTANRPVTSGRISGREALAIAALLTLLSGLLIVRLNYLVKSLSIAGVILAGTYPYFKRFFAIPQAYLGIAFGFGIPMAFAIVLGTVPTWAWLLLLGNVFWTVAYDTEYAMADREDDLKIGIQTSAITFGRFDVAIILLCYAAHLAILLVAGSSFGMGNWFKAGLAAATLCVAQHYFMIRRREPSRCLDAFRQNNVLGAIVFAGVVLDYATR